jgi:hypothetical protein
MPFGVICQGCARKLEVADDYPRRKLRCPHCGAMCEVPPPGKERAALTIPPKSKAEKTKPAESQSAAPASPVAIKSTPTPVKPIPVVSQRAEEVYQFSDADDGKPYGVDGGIPKPCPNCLNEMEPDARICVACGYDRDTGNAPEKVFEPVEHEWEAGWPFQKRLKYCLLAAGVFMMLGLVGTIASHEWLSFILSWLTFSSMMLFMFGTFDRVNLERNKRGQVKLDYSWRCCFVEFRSERAAMKDFDGVVTGRIGEIGCLHWALFALLVLSGVLSALNLVLNALSPDTKVDVLDWLGMIILMVLGFVPAAIAFYIFFVKIEFYVALCAGHGFPAMYLYKGWDEDHMQELAKTISSVANLPYQQ